MIHDPEGQYFALMDTATDMGRQGHAAGLSHDDCPYEDRRLISAWKSGWRNAEQQRKQSGVTARADRGHKCIAPKP